MPVRLLMFAPPAEQPDQWTMICRPADARAAEQRSDTAERLAQAGIPDHDECWLILPGEDLLRTAISVPARNRRQAEQAAPFLLEEYLAEEVEGLHLAYGPRERDGRLHIAAMRPAILQAALKTLEEIGLRPSRALTAVDLLQPADNSLLVVVDSNRFWLRSDRGNGVCAERTLLEPIVSGLVADHLPEGIIVRHGQGDSVLDIEQLRPALQTADGEAPSLRLEAEAASPLLQLARPWLDGSAAPQQAINLLQGPFRRQQPGSARAAGWRWAAGLALLLVSAQLGTDIVRAQWLEQRSAALHNEAVDLFRQYFPDRQRIPDPRREVESLLARGGAGGSSGFLPMLGLTAGEISALEEDTGLQLRSLNYNARRGDLAVDMNVSNIDVLEALQAGLEQHGTQVRIESATQEAQNIRGRLRIGGGQ